MKEYRIKWQIELEKVVEAESLAKAIEVIQDIDCQYDGEYVVDSFEITKQEEM